MQQEISEQMVTPLLVMMIQIPITINADITSDIISDQSNTYKLGTAAKRWNEAFANNLTVDNLAPT